MKSKKVACIKLSNNNMEKKYLFTLKGINTEKVDQRFGITIMSNINEMPYNPPCNTTKISDLSSNKNIPEIISFFDDAKKSHKCSVSMVDFHTQKEIVSGNCCNSYDCFWCRNNIPSNVVAIGCPIKYIPTQAVKSYYSEISKDYYTIKENITVKKTQELDISEDDRLEVINKNYYLTDGIFCSFNCCMAYIRENRNNSMYVLSEMLLLKMYNDIYPSHIPLIEEAPHWRKLRQCGGDLSIDQFRHSFNKIEYKNHGYASSVINFKSIGVLFEEKLKF
jgi:hypothetical protein